MDYRKILNQPTRKDIVRSILSRENASRTSEITQDIGTHRETIHFHLDTLIQAGILMRDRDATDPLHRGGYVYYISYEDESLQDVLRELFPELMSVDASKERLK
jgi:predicted transcriptional regulator